MELTPLATKVLTLTLSSLKHYMIEMHSMMLDFSGTATVLTALYIIYVCVQAMFGKMSGDRLKELAWSMLILVGIVSCCFNGSFYVQEIVFPYITWIINTSSWFASKGNVSNFIGIFNHLDNGFALVYNQLMNQIPDGNLMTNAGEYFRAWTAIVAFSLSYGLMYICFLVLIIMSLFVVYVLFVIGIVCIFLSAFKETRHIFWAWSKAIANYSMMMVFAAIVMSVAYQGVESSLNLYANVLVEQGVFNAEFAALIVWSLVCFGILMKVPDLSSALTGGIATASTGVGAVVSLAGAAALTSFARGGGSSSSFSSTIGAGVSGARESFNDILNSKWMRQAGE
ncbi:type IV secretion system protein [Desulfovibrio sp. JC010]|uniref:type IV secretion system protein n=1 Tax=Desulfovibrio sp. JC010 TaxID=2593641 RepID=UPI0013CF8A74|nr:type IV secretion system protein [Desulfovibrio sp. JC010]NDV25988.1 type IV secretion system protein [Desulfovibrio sp. JC010]